MPRITKPATRERRSLERERHLNEIMDASEGIFLAKGYPGTTTDDLVDAAGISVGTLYNLFGSKDALYAHIVRRIIGELLAETKRFLEDDVPVEKAVENLIRVRIAGFDRQKLFFQLFSGDQTGGAYPAPEQLAPDLRGLLRQDLALVSGIFVRGMERGELASGDSLHLAIGLDGIITAFMSYWERPNGRDSQESVVRSISETFFARCGLLPRELQTQTLDSCKEIYLNRFDTERLRELIGVVRWFGNPDSQSHLDDLEQAMRRGRIVDPRYVPGDVVTMNSRVELRDMRSGGLMTRTLVFPVDAVGNETNVSILDPLGTALLGCRVGDLVSMEKETGEASFRVERIVYQPESAGDFHR